MIDRSHALPILQQARQLEISRGSFYYWPGGISPADLAIMRRIDVLHMAYPFADGRLLRDLLAGEGTRTGRLHVATLMKTMGSRRSIAGRARRSRRRATGSTRICCALRR